MASELQKLKRDYQWRRKSLEEIFLNTNEGEIYLSNHTELLDEIVKEVCNSRLREGEIALFATAGYGRKEQFPYSDVDLLFLTPEKSEESEDLISRCLYDLWDLGLILGHQVWTLEELSQLDLEDYQFILALFNQRFLVGDEDLGDLLENSLASFLNGYSDDLIREIYRTVQNRHEKFQNTIYQLEPDLKESPGCLRDHLAAQWIQRLKGDLAFSPYSSAEIENAYRYMKNMRILVHLKAKRDDNRLTHQMQEDLRHYVGYDKGPTDPGVEALMRDYFLNARIINNYCTAMLRAVRPLENSRQMGLQFTPEIHSLTDILVVFQHSSAETGALPDRLRKVVVQALEQVGDRINPEEVREEIKQLFRPRSGLYNVLSLMYELGVLEALFPEFGSIKAKVIRDFYHKYTVDEHTLIAIKNIEDLTSNDQLTDGRFQTTLEDTIDPYQLTLALLFHDVGKSQEGEHVDSSARMAESALERLNFESEEIDTIKFLIESHLAMSSVIFRRDLEDRDVIDRFANLVGTPERLRLLTLLTYADIKAVAPGTLNDWKKDLLWQLYVEAYRKLTLKYGEKRIHEKTMEQRLLNDLPPDISIKDFEKFLEGFPSRYLISTPINEIYEHFRMAQSLSEDNNLAVSLFPRKTHYELCVVTPDRARLFSRIVGLLSYFEMNIHRGYGLANKSQTILDFFNFSDSRGIFVHQYEKDRFLNMLRKVLSDELSLDDLLLGKQESVLFRNPAPTFEPSVYFEDEESDAFTILEIIAPDQIGLLYRVSRKIAKLDCNIELALISTEGKKAVDVFYLSHQGGKLSSELKEELAHSLRAVARQ
jgi:[protein-PII] uridylyltransferase